MRRVHAPGEHDSVAEGESKMRNLAWGLALVLALVGAVAQTAHGGARKPTTYTLDAPNGSAQWSTVVKHLKDGDRFAVYITPLKQYLGDSVYATEIQVHVGPIGLGFARMDPTIINPYLDDPNKLPPLWEMRQIVGQSASAIEDPRTMALGAAAISLEDGQPALLQGVFQKGVLHVAWRPTPKSKAISIGRYRTGAKELPLRTRVIGYRAKFTVP